MIFPLISSFLTSLLIFFALCHCDFGFFATYLNLFRSVKYKANALYDQTLTINKFSSSHGDSLELVNYKFFTKLIEDLLKYHRSFGINIFDDLSNIRLALSQDSVQSQKIQNMIKGALLEILLIVMMSYAIILFAVHYAQLSFTQSDIIIILSMQVIGIVLLITLLERSHRQIFKKYYPYLKAVYSLQVFIKSRTAINEMSENLQLSKLEKDKDTSHILDRIEMILKTITEYGKIEGALLNDLVNQTWSCFELKTQKFQSRVLKQKIFVIMSVIVPSYLYIFYALLKSLTL